MGFACFFFCKNKLDDMSHEVNMLVASASWWGCHVYLNVPTGHGVNMCLFPVLVPLWYLIRVGEVLAPSFEWLPARAVVGRVQPSSRVRLLE